MRVAWAEELLRAAQSQPVAAHRNRPPHAVAHIPKVRFGREPGASHDARDRSGLRQFLKTGRHVKLSPLAHALDDERAAGRVVESHGQDFLVFRRIVPALDRRDIGEFEDDDAFGLRSAFDQFGRAAP
jgi:hypothetical protein